MKHIVSFSGGRTSAYLVHLIEQKRINDGWDVEYVFMDTGAEHPKTYEFIKKCVDHFKINLVCLRPVIHEELGTGTTYKIVNINSLKWDLSVWNDMTNKYGNPYNPLGGFCTDRLKTTIFKKYIKQYKSVTTWLGIRVDEQRRLKGKYGIKYLAEISSMDKTDIIGWWSQQAFDLEIQEHLGNCVFCIKKGINKVALAIKDEPELADDWKKMTENSRVMGWNSEGAPINAMYRGKLSIDGVAELYKDVGRDELHMSTKHAKRFESGSCSESCEVFSGQSDMFEDLK